MSGFEDIMDRLKSRAAPDPAMQREEYECLKCRDTGWIECKDGNGYTFMKHCDCWAVKEARRLMKQSGISLEFQNKGFKDFDTRGNPQVGAGKTHLGVAICNNLMNRNVAVCYMAYRNAVTKIKQVMTDEPEYNRVLRPYMQTRVLYIDDLLKGRVTESDVNILYEIVNYRYMNNLPMIISTEKSIEGLLEFDEAIGSRIIEMCRGNIVQLRGKELNYRLTS